MSMSQRYASRVILLGFIFNTAIYGQGAVDFSRLMVAGDSLSAGYQSAQLIETGQVHGYANVIATQAGTSLNLPLLPSPGYPQITVEGYAIATGLTPIARRNTLQTMDLAVPGFNVAALVGLSVPCPPDFSNAIFVMAAEILNPNCTTNPGPTQLQEAVALRPTTTILWIGSNDALFTILFGNDPTDIGTFSYFYHIAATTMAQASGHLIVANIPDVTLAPYLTSVSRLAAILKLPVPVVEAVFHLQPGDMVTPYAFPAIQAMGSSLKALPDFGPQGPIVIRAVRLSQIRASVIAYNAVIASEAMLNRATLVDIYSLMNNLAENGAKVGNRTLTTAFMGGLFSLDGIHPTNTGYAIIANEFIKTINRSLDTDIPPVSVQQVSQTDPLILPASAPGKHHHVSVEVADGLQALGRQ